MKISICTWKWCREKFSEYIIKRIKNDIKFYWKDNIIIDTFECMWDCKNWPNIIIDKTIYPNITPAKASELIFKTNKKI